jgi:LPS-assembly lipoprotein
MSHAALPASSIFNARHSLRWFVAVGLLVLLTACGFRLKGQTPLPFQTIYTNIAENSAFGAQLRRVIRATSPDTRFIDEPKEAQVRLTQLSLTRGLEEVSISVEGQVEEYELSVTIIFQLTDAQGHILLPPTTLSTTREIPYDSGALQAKQGEIGSLYVEMQQSLIDRMVRRITSPEVMNAYENSENLPIDESQVQGDDAPVQNDDVDIDRDLLRMPNMNPTSSFY